MYLTSQCALLQYIYISRQELEAVAEYIKKRGRIAIGELAAKSNTFIDLEAKATVVSLLDVWLSKQGKSRHVIYSMCCSWNEMCLMRAQDRRQ